MKKVLLSCVLMFLSNIFILKAQNCSCGPPERKDFRELILNEDLNKEPYNAIIHLKVERWIGTNLSTVSLFNEKAIITANHNLMYAPFISNIQLNMNGDSLKLKRRDFKIRHYHQGLFHKKNKDIAILILKKQAKDYFKNYSLFGLASVSEINDEEQKLNLTGFPCDYSGTLIDKSDYLKNIYYSPTNNFISYNGIYTCTGDSGAPLWYKAYGSYKIVGIHHGKVSNVNMGVRITEDVINWIERKINN